MHSCKHKTVIEPFSNGKLHYFIVVSIEIRLILVNEYMFIIKLPVVLTKTCWSPISDKIFNFLKSL